MEALRPQNVKPATDADVARFMKAVKGFREPVDIADLLTTKKIILDIDDVRVDLETDQMEMGEMMRFLKSGDIPKRILVARELRKNKNGH